jgi:hypothetical protein
MSGAAVAAQLNDDTHYDFEAQLVAPTDIDSAEDLESFQVVILGDAGFNDDGYTIEMAQALRTWVLEDGGAVVGSGWIDYSLSANVAIDEILDDVLPIDAVPFNYDFCGASATITIGDEPHPITEGLPPDVPSHLVQQR